MSRLQNKVAVITGGTSGIGLAAAQRFVAEGAFVYIFARRQDELDKTVASIGRNITGVQTTQAGRQFRTDWRDSGVRLSLH